MVGGADDDDDDDEEEEEEDELTVGIGVFYTLSVWELGVNGCRYVSSRRKRAGLDGRGGW